MDDIENRLRVIEHELTRLGTQIGDLHKFSLELIDKARSLLADVYNANKASREV